MDDGGPALKIQLILAGPYTACLKTQKIWEEACDRHAIKLDIMDIEHTASQTLIQQHNIKSFPALIANGKIKAVGHPTAENAEEIICQLSDM